MDTISTVFETKYVFDLSEIPLDSQITLVSDSKCSLQSGMGTGDVNGVSSADPDWNNLLVCVGRERDKDAFSQLFAHFAPRVKSFLLKIGTDINLAEEISQEAMIMVWRRAETYNPQQSSASTWIFTIARNKRIDRLRRENRPVVDVTDPAFASEAPETGDFAVIRKQEDEKIRHALKNLPEEQAKMIFSAYYEEKSHREIADESGVPLGTVKSRIRLALNRLRAHLDEFEGSTNR